MNNDITIGTNKTQAAANSNAVKATNTAKANPNLGQVSAKDSFANIGSVEGFDLNQQIDDVVQEGITLTIDDESEGIIVDPKISGFSESSNFFVSLFNRINFYFISKSNVNVRDKATFFHLLAVMTNSGIPMIRSLRSLVVQMNKSPKMQSVIESLEISIENGNSLSLAMADFPKVFPESELGMVQSGEVSGQLSKVLDNLAIDTEKSYLIRAKLKSAMMYPMVIFALLIVVLIAMMVYVVPKLTDLFDSFGGELPFLTRAVVGTSDFLIHNKVSLIISVLILLGIFSVFKKKKRGRYILDNLKINMPVFGPLFKKFYLARFARSLSNLMDSNISILRTLEITANSIGNEVYKKHLLLSLEDIKQGISLAENLSNNSLFPPMLVSMIDVGEQTAQLDTITAKVAKFYETEVDTSINGFSKIVEPIMLRY